MYSKTTLEICTAIYSMINIIMKPDDQHQKVNT